MDSTVMYNPGHEDQIRPGNFLISEPSLYLVESFLGRGTFGTVAKCTRVNDTATVAIKLIKSSRRVEAFLEISNLHKIKKLDPDKCNIVRWYSAFEDRGHLCLEFEQLDKSLHHLLKERNFQPLLLKEIRPIMQQLATALEHLKDIQVIHADLKLENIMLVNHQQVPFKVKLIDFGLAYEKSAVIVGSHVQTRFYRAPEILLGLPFSEAIDMWSLGCTAAELFLGAPLYPGNSSYNMMRYIIETQEMPPDSMLDRGVYTGRYFKWDINTNLWSLKAPVKKDAASWERRTSRLSCLDHILHIWPIRSVYFEDVLAELVDLIMFVDMVKAMLHLEESYRITPWQVLSHPFTSMSFFQDSASSIYRWSCVEAMINCQRSFISDSTTQTLIPDSLVSPETFEILPYSDLKSVGILTPMLRTEPEPFPPEQSCGEELSEPASTFSHFYHKAKWMDCDEDETY